MSRRVTGGDGRVWRVGRRWAPRLGTESVWRRFRRRMRSARERAADAVDDPGCLELFGEGIAIALVIIVAGLVLVFIGIPLLVAIVDLVIVLIVTVFGVIGRVLFRRPWVVEAVADDGEASTWQVVGWRASGVKVDEVATALQAGLTPQAD